MPVLDTRWKPGANLETRDREPWLGSGVLVASTIIKAFPALLGGILVTALDAGADINVNVWDSADAAALGDELIARVTITAAVAFTQSYFVTPSKEGIYCAKGIWIELVAGDAAFIVYYK